MPSEEADRQTIARNLSAISLWATNTSRSSPHRITVHPSMTPNRHVTRALDALALLSSHACNTHVSIGLVHSTIPSTTITTIIPPTRPIAKTSTSILNNDNVSASNTSTANSTQTIVTNHTITRTTPSAPHILHIALATPTPRRHVRLQAFLGPALDLIIQMSATKHAQRSPANKFGSAGKRNADRDQLDVEFDEQCRALVRLVRMYCCTEAAGSRSGSGEVEEEEQEDIGGSAESERSRDGNRRKGLSEEERKDAVSALFSVVISRRLAGELKKSFKVRWVEAEKGVWGRSDGWEMPEYEYATLLWENLRRWRPDDVKDGKVSEKDCGSFVARRVQQKVNQVTTSHKKSIAQDALSGSNEGEEFDKALDLAWERMWTVPKKINVELAVLLRLHRTIGDGYCRWPYVASSRTIDRVTWLFFEHYRSMSWSNIGRLWLRGTHGEWAKIAIPPKVKGMEIPQWTELIKAVEEDAGKQLASSILIDKLGKQ